MLSGKYHHGFHINHHNWTRGRLYTKNTTQSVIEVLRAICYVFCDDWDSIENILCLLLVAMMVCVLYTFREKIPVTLQIMKIGMKAWINILRLALAFWRFSCMVWFAVCSILYVSLHRQVGGHEPKFVLVLPLLFVLLLCMDSQIIRYVVDYVHPQQLPHGFVLILTI